MSFQGYMGGNAGQGYGGFNPPSNDMYNLEPPPPSQTIYGSNETTSTTAARPAMGSITQFATPESQQQAQQQTTEPAQQQAQQPPSSNSYVARSEASSYAARSAMAHAATGAAVPSSPAASTVVPSAAASTLTATTTTATGKYAAPESAAAQAHQTRMLTDATRKVQEHAYYMKLAMDKDDLPNVLDRAALMVGELGGSPESSSHHHHHHHHHHLKAPLSPKNYYELHMRALDEMPNLEEYIINTNDPRFVYDAVQYCPKVLPRLYLQICAASALLQSGKAGAKWVLADLREAVKCVQNPVRGLFLRHYLLQVLRDKLPDGTEEEGEGEMAKGTTQDAYEFVLANFIAMNKLWVRIQHLPGEGKSKEQRKRREKERNELRILVGTNLVRLSQMEGVTSQIYGQVILPKILDQIVACGDPLAQAYLMDCIIQVFPDEFHIETLAVLLAVCPKLRDKVNIRTILQNLMDRLANYYADEELLDERDTNQVKMSLARDSFHMFEECVQNVYNARGPKLTPKEVVRLQTALLNFSLKCYPGNMEQVNRCLGVCVASLHQAHAGIPEEGNVAQVPTEEKSLDEASVKELEKLLSIPLDSLALKVLKLDHYSELLAFLPFENRRDVAVTMLKAVISSGVSPRTVKEIEELFSIISPVIRAENVPPPPKHETIDRTSNLMKDLGITRSSMSFGLTDVEPEGSPGTPATPEENNLVSKLVHLLDHEDTDVAYDMLVVARNHLFTGGKARIGTTMVPLVFSALQLAGRIHTQEQALLAPKEALDQSPENQGDSGDLKVGEGETPTEEEAGDVPEPTTETPVGTEVIAPENTGGAPDAQETAGETEEKSSDAAIEETEQQAGATLGEVGCSPETEIASAAASDGNHEKSQAKVDASLSLPPKTVSCQKVFVFLQKTIAMLSSGNAETGVKLYLHTSVAAESFDTGEAKSEFAAIAYELISQAFVLYEEEVSNSSAQQRCLLSMVGTLLACQTLENGDYESLIIKVTQYSAKLLKKPDQCRMVTLSSHLFYPTGSEGSCTYRNPQRTLECLQRALKLADACTSVSPGNVGLFVDLLDTYVHYFEHDNPSVTDKYVSGLIALISEHLNSISPLSSSDTSAVSEARAQFDEIIKYIKRKKVEAETAERFAPIKCDKK